MSCLPPVRWIAVRFFQEEVWSPEPIQNGQKCGDVYDYWEDTCSGSDPFLVPHSHVIMEIQCQWSFGLSLNGLDTHAWYTCCSLLQNNTLTRPIVYIVSDVEQKQANKLKDIIKRHQVLERFMFAWIRVWLFMFSMSYCWFFFAFQGNYRWR